jgi:AraC-like DNA-binding protein
MERVRPLNCFPKITTNRVEEAEFELSQTLTDLQIKRIDDRRSFQLEMNGFNIGSSSLVYNQFRANTKIEIGMDIDYTLFVFGRGVPCTFFVDSQPVVVSQQKAAILARGRKVQIERPKNSEAIVLRTSMSDLLHHFEELTARHHRGSLIFDHSIDLIKGPGAMLKRMINYLVYELDHNDQVVKNPGLLKSYDDMLMTALLALPHNHREKLYAGRRKQAAPGLVHRAEEYMRAHLKEVISISDLIRICGCSQSVLFSAFRNARGYSPMEFLTEQRLQYARGKLQKSHPKASVLDIAVDCGFRHLGRFSQVYRKRFGERPSDTLRKGK